MDCNDAGGQAISAAALLFPLYQTSRCLNTAEQANGGYDVELSDGFDEGEKFGDGDLLVFQKLPKKGKRRGGVILITPLSKYDS